MAELEDLEQQELEENLLEVGEPSHVLERVDPIADLPAVRKSLIVGPIYLLLTLLLKISKLVGLVVGLPIVSDYCFRLLPVTFF